MDRTGIAVLVLLSGGLAACSTDADSSHLAVPADLSGADRPDAAADDASPAAKDATAEHPDSACRDASEPGATDTTPDSEIPDVGDHGPADAVFDSGAPAPDLYSSCGWPPPEAQCPDLSCVSGNEEARFYSLFYQVLFQRLAEDAGYMNEHFSVLDVSSMAGGRIFRVDYAYHHGWLQMALVAEAFLLGPGEPSMQDQLQRSVHVNRRYGPPVPFDVVAAAIVACGGEIDRTDWCRSLLVRADGALLLAGRMGTIDFEANRCTWAQVDLMTGAHQCSEVPCYSDEGCDGLGLTTCPDGCSSLTDDAQNCGVCDHRCQAGEACFDSQCVPAPPCEEGLSPCFLEGVDFCADLLADDRHCGACGHACDPGESCVEGQCRCGGTGPDCERPLTCCGDECADLSQDSDHCWRCELACTGGAFCQDRQCVCPEGLRYCDDGCIDPVNDAENCGGCGQSCGPGSPCLVGHCFETCSAASEEADCASEGPGACCQDFNGQSVCFSEPFCRVQDYLEWCGWWMGTCGEGLLCSSYEGSDGERCVRGCSPGDVCTDGTDCQLLASGWGCSPPPQNEQFLEQCEWVSVPRPCVGDLSCFSPRVDPQASEADEHRGYCTKFCQDDPDCDGGTLCFCPDYYRCVCAIPCPSGSAVQDCPDGGESWHCDEADPSPFPLIVCVPDQ